MKTFLFIDGTNLYSAQYELFGPNKYLNFPKFIKEVENKIKIKFDQIYFYASYSPQPEKPTIKEKHYLKNEALFYRSVKQTKNLFFFTGYRSKTSGKEKEVDVKLTADMISFAFLNEYQTVYLFTGDADFLQALFNIKRYKVNININLICINNKIMFKGAFYFLTYILYIKNLREIKFHRNQKIKIVQIKSPDMLACRVG